jgi:hypothetical protein
VTIYFSLIVGLALCIASVFKSRRVVNVLFINASLFVLMDCVGNLVFFGLTRDIVNQAAFSLVMLINLVYISSFAFGYMGAIRKSRWAGLFKGEVVDSRLAVKLYLFGTTSISFFLLIVLVYFSGSSLFTRELYENTRSFYGPIFFGIQMLCSLNIAIAVLYCKSVTRVAVSVVNFLLIAGLGSKGVIVFCLLIILTPQFVKRSRTLRSFVTVFVLGFLLVLLSFYGFYYYTAWAQDDFLLGVTSFLDGTRNFALLIEKWRGFMLGQLTIEDNLYMLVPRYVFESKPLVFGSGYLCDEFFKFVAIDKGAPSFTRFGRLWADFGYFSFIVVSMIGYCWGRLGAAAEDKLECSPGLKSLIVYMLSISQAFLNPGGLVFTVQLFNYLIVCFVVFLVSWGGAGEKMRFK